MARERWHWVLGFCLLLFSLPAWADWTATGTVYYQDREFDQTGFTGVEPYLPVRFAEMSWHPSGYGGRGGCLSHRRETRETYGRLDGLGT